MFLGKFHAMFNIVVISCIKIQLTDYNFKISSDVYKQNIFLELQFIRKYLGKSKL